MAESDRYAELLWEIRYLHHHAETYAEQWEDDHRAGIHPPGITRPKRRRGPCRIKRMARNDRIVSAVDLLVSTGKSLAQAFTEMEVDLDLPDLREDAIKSAYQLRSRQTR